MIRLDSTTKKLQAVLGGAITTNQLQCVVSFFDENPQGEDTSGASKETNTNSTTDVDICSAPVQNFVRNIDTLTIYNRDTVSATVTVKIDDGGTESILVKATLSTLETLSYDHESGWQVTTADGSLKTSLATFPVASDTVQGIIELAVQSEMETGTDVTRAVTPGRQQFHPSAAKAWWQCTYAGVVTTSYNVTSVTDNGAGDGTVNLTTAFSSANFCVAGIVDTSGSANLYTELQSTSATTVRQYTKNLSGTLTDGTNFRGVAFGDQ